MDPVHPTMATKLSYGWIRKGKDKLINTIGSRTRLKIIGSIQLGKLAETVSVQYERINQASVNDFLGKLRQQHSEKMHSPHLRWGRLSSS
ncbi:transposase [Shewanella surugensis]|uniref:Transposase n=1 Tax=Shewanella surugensis TaxID=212020 RepID=A0ABT0LJN0_9GAMM|nr:transposase [Shewanella surugensis]MCL1127901.1 transposase [Shewanella surugensis]